MGWAISLEAEDVALGQGLPVLALDQPNWPSLKANTGGTARALRSVRAELVATHGSGWQISALARSEARLEATEDAVAAAALDATQSDPSAPRSFYLAASSQSWQGQGIRVTTPWWTIGPAEQWRWQVDAQFLHLTQLRSDEIAGDIQYNGAGVYDFNLHSDRSSVGISSPFLRAPASSGLGAALSVAVDGEPTAGLHLNFRAYDWLSQLQWSDMATDASRLKSQVTTRAPDGSLDYAALLNGQLALTNMARKMSVHWSAHASWMVDAARHTGAVTARMERKAGIDQFWLGWDNAALNPASPHWRVEIEPRRHAVSTGLVWGNWRVLLATDGKGADTEHRRWLINWSTRL